MNKELKKLILGIIVLLLSISNFAQDDLKKALTENKTGKDPIIVIPGVMGTKLKNKVNGKEVWVKFDEAKEDDLKLPISLVLTSNRDNIVAGEIVDKIKISRFLPGVSIYSPLLNYLEKDAGYKKGDLDNPTIGGDKDTYYIFTYDWRRGNSESAQLLIKKIERLKAKLRKPNLKFDILAHSMGGLIARYAAMYGLADLNDNPKPTWSGAKHFSKIITIGTPNEGAMNSLEAFYYGYTIDTLVGRYGIKSLNREAIFTSPAAYQLLPHGNTAKFYDENLQPIKIDIYDPENWKKYGWTILSDEKIMENYSPKMRNQAEKFLKVVLQRAKLFHAALDVKTTIPKSLGIYAFGSQCKDTLDGAIVYFDKEENKWKTILRSDSFKKSDGEKVESKLVKQTIFSPGDGTVPLHSLLGENVTAINGTILQSIDSILPEPLIVCESHTAIPNSKKVQEVFTSLFTGQPVPKTN
ncbi:MAG: hypothetical protein K1X72_02230 [Pyrinomonadaceae bacterium]|nr:hypothetical protein [Pyrinomonadaceae bacterium]